MIVDSLGIRAQRFPSSADARCQRVNELNQYYGLSNSTKPKQCACVPSGHLCDDSNLNPVARGSAAMSFIMLPENRANTLLLNVTRQKHGRRPSYLSQRETGFRLWELLSGHSNTDHPMCAECVDAVIEKYRDRLACTLRERDTYTDFLRQVKFDLTVEEDIVCFRNKLSETVETQAKILEDLRALEERRDSCERQLIELQHAKRDLDVEEQVFWAERNAVYSDFAQFQDERGRIEIQHAQDYRELQRLRRTNVYNDTFAIGHDGFFGTINGLRLGRLADRQVGWAEINAAWGHACLLLSTVAEKLACEIHGYVLQPRGSTSKILQFSPKKPTASQGVGCRVQGDRTQVHELFSSGEFGLTIGLFNSKFDSAMVAFLECLRQVIQHARNRPAIMPDGSLMHFPEIPFMIEREKIGDASIRLGGFSQEESWTKACKSTLICCKILLAHASIMT